MDRHPIDKAFDAVVAQYGELDAKEKALKKDLEDRKLLIKNTMKDSNIDKWSAGGYTVSYSESERVSFDEEKALNVLKAAYPNRDSSCPYVKTVEVIDMDALEAAIYNNEIDNDILVKLNDCRTATKVVTLKCSKTKTKEE